METIFVRYIQEEIIMKTTGVNKGKYMIHFAGVSDNPRKFMELQVWEMPFDSKEEANKTLKEYQQRLAEGKGSFMMIRTKSKVSK